MESGVDFGSGDSKIIATYTFVTSKLLVTCIHAIYVVFIVFAK